MRKGSKQTPEAIERNRQAHLGKKFSEETKEKMKVSHLGENNAFFGRKHSDETKEKMRKPRSEETRARLSEAKKGIVPANIEILKQSRVGAVNSEYQRERASQANTGLIRSEESKELNRVAHVGIFPSDETREKISKNRMGIYCGADNHMWKGGTSFLPYCHKFNARRKQAVRNFFNNQCICCGKHKYENIIRRATDKELISIELSVHHIDHDKTQGCKGTPFNLVPLCHDCHNDELTHQEEYKKYINQVLDAGFGWGVWSREQYEREVMYPEESNET